MGIKTNQFGKLPNIILYPFFPIDNQTKVPTPKL